MSCPLQCLQAEGLGQLPQLGARCVTVQGCPVNMEYSSAVDFGRHLMEGHADLGVLLQNWNDVVAPSGEDRKRGMQVQRESHQGEFSGRENQVIVNGKNDIPRVGLNSGSRLGIRIGAVDIPCDKRSGREARTQNLVGTRAHDRIGYQQNDRRPLCRHLEVSVSNLQFS